MLSAHQRTFCFGHHFEYEVSGVPTYLCTQLQQSIVTRHMNSPAFAFDLNAPYPCIEDFHVVEHKLIQWQQDQQSNNHSDVNFSDTELPPGSPSSVSTHGPGPAESRDYWKRQADSISKRLEAIENDVSVPIDHVMEYWHLKLHYLRIFEEIVQSGKHIPSILTPTTFRSPSPPTFTTISSLQQEDDNYTEKEDFVSGGNSLYSRPPPFERDAWIRPDRDGIDDDAGQLRSTLKRKRQSSSEEPHPGHIRRRSNSPRHRAACDERVSLDTHSIKAQVV